MRIAIASMFRNSTGYIDRYFKQMAQLTGWLIGEGYDIHLILAHGDSTDGTPEMLEQRAQFLHKFIKSNAIGSDLDIIEVNHGGPSFGSVDNETRWRNISTVCNAILDKVDVDADEFIIYVESDLIWDYTVMLLLLDQLREHLEIDAISPLCIHQQTGLFYDTWGYRKDGQAFRQSRPYHPGVGVRLTEIDSAGSCIVMKQWVAEKCRFDPPEKGIVGFGESIRAHGYTLWLDPTLTVHHP